MSLKRIIISALIIRLLIIPFFFHPDIKDINLRVSYLYTDKVLNIYEFLQKNSLTRVNAPDFVYPPLTYFSLGVYQFLIQPMLGNSFHSWLFDFSGLSSTSIYVFRYLMLLKFPYLIFDLLIGLFIYRYLPKDKKDSGLIFWFFNPLNLYAIYAIGQFDIIPSFLTFLSWYLWEKKLFKLSGLSLGLAASFKSYPLLLLLFFLFSKEKLNEKLTHSFLALAFYFLTILPFINSESFRQNVLFSGLTQRIFQLHIPLGGFHLSIFYILFTFLIILRIKFRSLPLWAFVLSTFLAIFSISKFHPQWIVWVTPFLTLAFIYSKINLWKIALLCLSFFMIFALFGDKFLTTGLLSPISPIFLEIPPLTDLLSSSQTHIMQTLTQTLFGLSSLLIIWKTFKTKPT